MMTHILNVSIAMDLTELYQGENKRGALLALGASTDEDLGMQFSSSIVSVVRNALERYDLAEVIDATIKNAEETQQEQVSTGPQEEISQDYSMELANDPAVDEDRLQEPPNPYQAPQNC